jgi:hypothetical protein
MICSVNQLVDGLPQNGYVPKEGADIYRFNFTRPQKMDVSFIVTTLSGMLHALLL